MPRNPRVLHQHQAILLPEHLPFGLPLWGIPILGRVFVVKTRRRPETLFLEKSDAQFRTHTLPRWPLPTALAVAGLSRRLSIAPSAHPHATRHLAALGIARCPHGHQLIAATLLLLASLLRTPRSNARIPTLEIIEPVVVKVFYGTQTGSKIS